MKTKEPENNNTDMIKEVAKNIYEDGGKAIVKPTGELLGLIPRAIKAALSPLERWTLQKEYNIEETKKLLEEKLKNIPPESIQTPEPHIAVPALQYISYCMNNEELRNMYANLLASSMNKAVKNGVHPAFVEIIKQLCPDEAKILSYISGIELIPTINLRKVTGEYTWVNIVTNFSNIGEICRCEYQNDNQKYFDNLIRLGLIKSGPQSYSLTDKSLYEPLKNHTLIQQNITRLNTLEQKYSIEESYMAITDFGKSFCRICLPPIQIIIN